MVGSQIAALVSFCPELAVFDLPMVFAPYTGDQIEEVLNGDSETRAGLDVAFENANWHLLGFLQNATLDRVLSDHRQHQPGDAGRF